jgi:hypothetical protein
LVKVRKVPGLCSSCIGSISELRLSIDFLIFGKYLEGFSSVVIEVICKVVFIQFNQLICNSNSLW